jgi:hypothetical protein
MAILAAKKSYVFGGTLTANDAAGLPVEFRAGDPVPDEWLSRRAPGEIDALRSTGMLREIGAKPAPKPAPEPPKPLTIAETLQVSGLQDATVQDGHVTGVPGCDIRVVDRPRESDFKRLLDLGRETRIVVHRVDEIPLATLTLVQLAQLLAARGLMR